MRSRSAGAMAALLLATVGALAVACGGTETTLIATTGDYIPFNYINEAGEIEGLERDLGDELCRRAALRCEWVVRDWETLIPDVIGDEFDVILAGMSITAGREEWIDFTRAYYPPTPSVYLARAGSGEGALGGVIGATEQTIYSDYLTGAGIAFRALGGSVDAAGAVLEGDVDAALVDHGYAVAQLARYEGALEVVGPSVLIDRGLGIGIRKGSELRGKLEAALASMKVDGRLNALIREWLGAEASTFPRPLSE